MVNAWPTARAPEGTVTVEVLPAGFTLNDQAGDVCPWKLGEFEYVAVIAWVPTARPLTWSEAVPPETLAVPRGVLPSKNVTIPPVGVVPDEPVRVALNV